MCNRIIDGELYRFELLENDLPAAKFSLVRKDHQAFSPQNAPYGSLEYLEHVPIGQVQDFMGEIIRWCSESSIQSVQIVQPPDCYPVADTSGIYAHYHGEIVCTDVNQHFVVQNEPQTSYAKSELYQLNRCKREGFTTKKEGIEGLSEAYNLLVNARARKNYPVTMSFENLRTMFENHPRHYHLFTVRDGELLISMAVTIHISPQLLYTFYLADHEDYLAQSPTVMVVDTILRYAESQAYGLVDLGVSSVNGKLNSGLFEFKKNLGAIKGSKKTFLIKP